MATDKKFMEFVLDQIKNAGEITAKSMFGEYSVYSDGKLFALLADNRLLIKPTESGRLFIKNVVEASPYPGAKPCFLIENLDDRDWLSELVRITVKELPEPKPKKKKVKPNE
jgi:TfoX/Sxy family transcriptional regulator of competence genes